MLEIRINGRKYWVERDQYPDREGDLLLYTSGRGWSAVAVVCPETPITDLRLHAAHMLRNRHYH